MIPDPWSVLLRDSEHPIPDGVSSVIDPDEQVAPLNPSIFFSFYYLVSLAKALQQDDLHYGPLPAGGLLVTSSFA